MFEMNFQNELAGRDNEPGDCEYFGLKSDSTDPLSEQQEISQCGGSPSSFRAARLKAIGREIALGEYETLWRIRATVDRLLDVLQTASERPGQD